VALALGGRYEHGGAAGGLACGEGLAGESLVQQQVAWRRPGLQQVAADVALVDGGGHDAPGPDDAGAQVRLDGQPEAVEPFGVGGVAAEPGMQPIGSRPAVRAADPRGVPDRQRAGIDLLAVIGRDLPGEVAAQLPGRAPQPADPPVSLAYL